MRIGTCIDQNMKSITYKKCGQVIFSPLGEMIASMHVISNPKHHLGRSKWWERIQTMIEPEIIKQIQEIGMWTNDWMILMDFAILNECIDYDIEEHIEVLEHMPIVKWNKIFKDANIKITQRQKNEIMIVLRRYYDQFFLRELQFLQPIIIRELSKVFITIKKQGFETYIKTIHERLKISHTQLIYLKDKEYHYECANIKLVQFTGTTFLAPHLIMDSNIETKTFFINFTAENYHTVPPLDLAGVYNALSDPTRLMILKELKKRENTTQKLSLKLNLTEAAISKQLKILYEAKIVGKRRQGMYVYYFINTKTLDFLTYFIYEYLN